MTDYSRSGPVPLWAPYYGASFSIAFKRYWQKYATFSGRASRSEYWWWALVSFIVGTALGAVYLPSLLAGSSGGSDVHMNAGLALSGGLGAIWGLATIVPSLALTFRRLHDANFSAWFYLLAFIPVVGGIVILILVLMPSNPAGARFDQRG